MIELDIRCPHCESYFQESVELVESGDSLSCPHCNARISVTYRLLVDKLRVILKEPGFPDMDANKEDKDDD